MPAPVGKPKQMTLRDAPCFRELGECVKDFAAGRRIVEIVNTGNWGDALIHAGQAQFLKDIGVEPWRFSIFRLRRMQRHKFLFISKVLCRRAIVTGNGAFQPFYDRPQELASVAQSFSRVLIMPSSFFLVPQLDAKRTTFWRRDERDSHERVPMAKFCHDMAFYLNPKPRTAVRERGVFFREDIEKGGYDLPEGNLDLSAQGTHATDHEIFLDRIGEYRSIYTDRLHIGIGGALLGREVHLFESRTSKIKSIFETSLRPFYDNVFFHTEPPRNII